MWTQRFRTSEGTSGKGWGRRCKRQGPGVQRRDSLPERGWRGSSRAGKGQNPAGGEVLGKPVWGGDRAAFCAGPSQPWLEAPSLAPSQPLLLGPQDRRTTSSSVPSSLTQTDGRRDDCHLHSPSGERPLRWLLKTAAAVAREHLQTPVARTAVFPRPLHGVERRLPVRWPGTRVPASTAHWPGPGV